LARLVFCLSGSSFENQTDWQKSKGIRPNNDYLLQKNENQGILERFEFYRMIIFSSDKTQNIDFP